MQFYHKQMTDTNVKFYSSICSILLVSKVTSELALCAFGLDSLLFDTLMHEKIKKLYETKIRLTYDRLLLVEINGVCGASSSTMRILGAGINSHSYQKTNVLVTDTEVLWVDFPVSGGVSTTEERSRLQTGQHIYALIELLMLWYLNLTGLICSTIVDFSSIPLTNSNYSVG